VEPEPPAYVTDEELERRERTSDIYYSRPGRPRVAFLRLTGDKVRKLSRKQLSTFPNLIALEIGYCKGLDLRPLLGMLDVLPQLQRLLLHWLELTALPPEIAAVPALRHLDLTCNPVRQLPPEIGRLRWLEHLEMGHNQLQALPDSVGDLRRLRYLGLWSGNAQRRLPDSFANLAALERLRLDSIRSLDLIDTVNKVSGLPRLQSLSLGESGSVQGLTLPECVGNLRPLRGLGLAATHLAALPESIGQLENLEWLGLNWNRLKRLPESITRLQKLRDLSLYDNPELDLDDTVAKLARLPALAELSFPSEAPQWQARLRELGLFKVERVSCAYRRWIRAGD
jgi:Leucine-rich repeat (LRR) protein